MILLLYLAHQPGPRLRWRGVRPKLCLGYGSRRRRLGRRRWFWREDVERAGLEEWQPIAWGHREDRKSTRLNSSHGYISYAVFCLKKKKKHHKQTSLREG